MTVSTITPTKFIALALAVFTIGVTARIAPVRHTSALANLVIPAPPPPPSTNRTASTQAPQPIQPSAPRPYPPL